jgi:hypothetical protein
MLVGRFPDTLSECPLAAIPGRELKGRKGAKRHGV